MNSNINNDEYIVIPNPIYDVVFKYLMEDLESAKIIISTLINEKIIKLDFEPISHTEKIKDPNSDKDIKLFHLDFTALIENHNGEEELIMIEIQKANRTSDIFRFKRYISANFQRKKEKEIIDPTTQSVEIIQQPIRLIPIFILNFRIEKEINDLLIKTNRIKTGVFKDKVIKNKNEFIDNLSFDIYVVQLPNLSKIKKEDYQNDEYKTKLYHLLKLFDQSAQMTKNRHRLLILKRLFPGYLERIIKRLQAADAENPDLEEQMNAEDEYLSELIKRDNKISFFKQKLEQTTQILQEKDKKLEQTTQILQEKDKKLEKQQKIILELAKTLKESNVPIDIIMKKTNLSKEQIENL